MRFVDDFEKREWFGRQALKELKELYPDFFKWEINFTTGKYDDFDAYWFVLEGQTLKKRVWVEIKWRDDDYDELILEKKKLKQLIQHRERLMLNKDEVMFLYLNFTPNKTIIFKIDDDMLHTTSKLKANKATSISRDEKVNKDVIYLNDSMGRKFDYRLNEKRLLSKYDVDYLLPRVKQKLDKNGGLWDILLN